TPRVAVERAVPLLQTSSARMLSDGGCIACHAQPLTQMAVTFAANRGWKVDQDGAAESLRTLEQRWMNADRPLLQGEEGGGSPDSLLYSSMALAAVGEPPSWNTD